MDKSLEDCLGLWGGVLALDTAVRFRLTQSIARPLHLLARDFALWLDFNGKFSHGTIILLFAGTFSKTNPPNLVSQNVENALEKLPLAALFRTSKFILLSKLSHLAAFFAARRTAF